MNRLVMIFFSFVLLSSCGEDGKLADKMYDLPQAKWTYDQIPQVPFQVDNVKITYSFYAKLRIQKDTYPFENLYILAHIKDPFGKIETTVVDLVLTDDLGRPLGKSSGSSIDYEIPIMVNKKLKGVGQYIIALEQNLRDSAVSGVESIGVKVVEGIPVF